MCCWLLLTRTLSYSFRFVERCAEKNLLMELSPLISRRIKFPKMSAFISFEKSNVHWSLSRWKQLKHDKHALVVFHSITKNKSDTFRQTIRFSYMCAKLSLLEKWSTCLPTCTSIQISQPQGHIKSKGWAYPLLNRTVVDSDWRFDNLCVSYL